ncbi:MAG TPA: secondary thiamine-phosphate synthase enzyme [Cyanobacteria bacterium UBA9971]|nr:secondary thiamine-phosphate synthase enzyme [Cyanobacteria bacterium UBA9971]
MPIITERFNLTTKGFTDIVDITEQVKKIINNHNLEDAQVMVYVAGSTASITNIEYEPGLLKDIPEAFEIIAPMDKTYHHDETWHDENGFAHVRASMIGNSKSFPVKNHELILGTWQQIVLIDFDNKPRTRCVYVQIIY